MEKQNQIRMNKDTLEFYKKIFVRFENNDDVDFLKFENRIRTLVGHCLEPLQDKVKDFVVRVDSNLSETLAIKRRI